MKGSGLCSAGEFRVYFPKNGKFRVDFLFSKEGKSLEFIFEKGIEKTHIRSKVSKSFYK